MSYNLPWRKDRLTGEIEPDSEYSHRAVVSASDGKFEWRTMVPGVQYVAPESKSEFIRILNSELDRMRQNGMKLHKVEVFVGHKPGWEFVP
jgi:hypothetical protein